MNLNSYLRRLGGGLLIRRESAASRSHFCSGEPMMDDGRRSWTTGSTNETRRTDVRIKGRFVRSFVFASAAPGSVQRPNDSYMQNEYVPSTNHERTMIWTQPGSKRLTNTGVREAVRTYAGTGGVPPTLCIVAQMRSLPHTCGRGLCWGMGLCIVPLAPTTAPAHWAQGHYTQRGSHHGHQRRAGQHRPGQHRHAGQQRAHAAHAQAAGAGRATPQPAYCQGPGCRGCAQVPQRSRVAACAWHTGQGYPAHGAPGATRRGHGRGTRAHLHRAGWQAGWQGSACQCQGAQGWQGGVACHAHARRNPAAHWPAPRRAFVRGGARDATRRDASRGGGQQAIATSATISPLPPATKRSSPSEFLKNYGILPLSGIPGLSGTLPKPLATTNRPQPANNALKSAWMRPETVLGLPHTYRQPANGLQGVKNGS